MEVTNSASVLTLKPNYYVLHVTMCVCVSSFTGDSFCTCSYVVSLLVGYLLLIM